MLRSTGPCCCARCSTPWPPAPICLVVGYPVAYVIAQSTQRTQRVLYLLVTLPMCMSFLLRHACLGGPAARHGHHQQLPRPLRHGPAPLIRNAGSVIMGMVYTYLPYMIMPLYTVIAKLDPRLIEAAQDLGCDNVQTFRRVCCRSACRASYPASPWSSSPR